MQHVVRITKSTTIEKMFERYRIISSKDLIEPVESWFVDPIVLEALGALQRRCRTT